jgi:hypothetical protein
MASHTRSERSRDKTLADSFPASDPPASGGITGAGKPDKPPHQREIHERPTGTPTSDRHAAETAHQWEHEEHPPAKAHEDQPRANAQEDQPRAKH